MSGLPAVWARAADPQHFTSSRWTPMTCRRRVRPPVPACPSQGMLNAPQCPRGTARLGLRSEPKNAPAAKLQLIFEVQRRGARGRPLPMTCRSRPSDALTFVCRCSQAVPWALHQADRVGRACHGAARRLPEQSEGRACDQTRLRWTNWIVPPASLDLHVPERGSFG